MKPVDFSERNRSIPDEWTGTAGTACATQARVGSEKYEA